MPRRTTDRVEDAAAWMLMAAALFVVVLGVLSGIGMHSTEVDRAQSEERARTRVEADLVVDAPLPGGRLDEEAPAGRTVRYTDGAGQQHDLVVAVPGRPPAGTVVPVWVDRDGRSAGAPFTRTDAFVLSVAGGFVVAFFGELLLVLLWMAVRWRLDRVNDARWTREWAQWEPEWSGRKG